MNGPLVVSATADRLTVGPDHPPGPAGLAVVRLLAGAATLAVDTASSATLVSLTLPRALDDPARRLAHLVLGARDAEALIRWSEETGPTAAHDAVLAGRSTPTDGGADRPVPIRGPLPLLGRLALGLEELTRRGTTEAAVAAALVDLGVLTLDLAPGLDPDPAGLALAAAGIGRWELVGPDGWDDAGGELLAATTRRTARWHKSLFSADPSLARRLEVLVRSRPEQAGAGAAAVRARSHRLESAAPSIEQRLSTVPAPVPAAGARPTGADLAAAPARPMIEVAFAPTLDGRVIAAEREDHHLVVHLGGLGDDPLWLRVHQAGVPPRLLALAPLAESGRPWRTAVALIGPEVATGDLLVDVTDEPSEPWRSPATRRTERAGHLGREAARLTRRAAAVGRSAGRGGREDAEAAWLDCARAWDDADDPTRAEQARTYATDPPVPTWASRDPLLTDLV